MGIELLQNGNMNGKKHGPLNIEHENKLKILTNGS
jgi:hypothetical protein